MSELPFEQVDSLAGS
ncbi:hypothetical protein CGLO_13384 [Colletotrichum gloeosporioides Cg-14]|uniref:Uncharacterized protein n=1 Tax=Colletotrichum gloeosporioides (strain Cg-14) TaxID=1237896 RepID=T0JWS0_COLGC|nr:hypothetical protein CGLO_13384 [Colletotrichum gloeosporioides Cg-14]